MSTWKMDGKSRANRRKWVDALLSGKYKQAQGALHDTGGFCCMGVACDLSGKGEWTDHSDFKTYDGEIRGGYMPVAVADWLGTETQTPAACGVGLDRLNDDEDFTFEEIALAILLEEEYQRTDGEA
jgi:hypothetical protein